MLPLPTAAGSNQVYTRITDVEPSKPTFIFPFVLFDINFNLTISNPSQEVYHISANNCLLTPDVRLTSNQYQQFQDGECWYIGNYNSFEISSNEIYSEIQSQHIIKNVTDGNFNQYEQINGTTILSLHSKLSELTGQSTYNISWTIHPDGETYTVSQVDDQLANSNATDQYPLSLNIELNNPEESVVINSIKHFEFSEYITYNTQILNTGSPFTKRFTSTCTGIGLDIAYSGFDHDLSDAPPICGSMVTDVLVPGGL